ncbi:MAG: ABC transporter substrate-binding protein [Anaerolineae bacterium]|nr:ABC transporter substrate-binding protein [Anaerolineae bacterium]
MLAEKVAAGELPPVEERLPKEPLIVEPIYEVGQYCDTIRRANTTSADIGDWFTQVREGFTRWDYTTGQIRTIPNIAKSWDIEDNGATYVFHLREGMKWSDGEPFTADDIMFWYEDMALNKELNPVFPSWLMVGGEPPVVEKIDDYTVKFTFAKPYGLLLEYTAFRGSEMIAPKHYLSQFHPSYVEKAELDKRVAEAKFEHWYQLLANRNSAYNNKDLPVLLPWKVEVTPDQGRLVAHRNPYYWKVDTAGNQLPYFDRFVAEIAQEQQAVLMKTVAGEVDYQYRHMGFANYSFLTENEERGNYTVLQWTGGSLPTIYVNHSVKDLELRKLFQDVRFKQALSLGMNRPEMIDLFWNGIGEPMNAVSRPGGLYWKEGYGKNCVEYDPDRANALLDEIGLDQRDSEGYRLRPDGKRLQFLMENYPAELGAPAYDIFSQVATYWQELGLDARAKEIERSLWSQRALGNEIDMPAYGIDEIQWTLAPSVYVPYGTSYWAPGFAPWALNPEAGEEPPDDIKQLITWYEELKAEPDPAKREELGHKILDQHNERIYIIGTVLVGILPMIRHNTMMNVMEKAVGDWCTLHESISWPFQMWRKEA